MVSTIDLPTKTKTPDPVINWVARISSPQNIPKRENLGFFTTFLALPAPVEEVKKLSAEEEKLWQVAREFTDAIPGMRPRGEIEESVSKGYLPTARIRWYPEVLEVVVYEFMNKDEVRNRALNNEYIDRGEFMRFYECRSIEQRKPEKDKWRELVDSRKPETGHWR